MNKVLVRLQVFFEEPFWVGVIELVEDDKLSVSKVVFGAEPKEYEIQEFLMENCYRLRFSPSIDAALKCEERINPKRRQREVKKQMQNAGIGTKSQQALNLLHEIGKEERRTRTQEQIEAEKEYRFKQKQRKKKEKHRGR